MCKSLYLFEVCLVAFLTRSSPSKHFRLVLICMSPRTMQACEQPQVLSLSNTEARIGNKKRAEGRVASSASREARTRPLHGKNEARGELN